MQVSRKSRRKRRESKLCIDCAEPAVIAGLCNQCDIRRKLRLKEYRSRLKRRVMDAYGGVCKCCSEAEIIFLEIDHVNNNGAEHRREIKIVGGSRFYKWLEKQGFPSDYQVLCSNCNRGKYRNNGVCPHQIKP